MERIRQRDQDVEKAAYEHRQKVLKEEELLRYRENDSKKTVEMELYFVKAEKDRMAQTIRDYELKIADLETLKLRLEKQKLEDIERFKSEYQRQMKDHDFEIHRRRLALDEDEHQVSLSKDRLANAETRLKAADEELTKLRTEFYTLQKQNQLDQKELFESRDQLKTLNHNLKNMTDVVNSRERECKTLKDENRSLLEMHKALKADSDRLKENQESLIRNLRMQLDETKDVIAQVKEGKEREFRKLREKCDEEIRRETDKYQFEYDKLRDEIQMFQRKLNQEESLNKQLGQLNEKMVSNMGELRNQYKIEMNEERIDILAGVQSQFQVQRATTTDDEILDRKKAIIELEREQREVQRDIKSLMKFEPASRILTEDPALADRVSQ